MTVFAKRRMRLETWGRVQNQIGELQQRLGAPHDLMMFRADVEDSREDDIFIGLPQGGLLSMFPGFEIVDRSSPPDFLTTLVVREDGFEERFPDIYRKRRSRLG